jgi:multiple sugar transport system ATP-binding protein
VSNLIVQDVWKIYKGEHGEDVVAVRDANFGCADGEFLALLGPSGSGKSSLLRMIAGLEDISKGKMFFGDKEVNDMPPGERNIALAFESYALYPVLSVYENLAFPLRASGISRIDITRKVEEIVDLFELAEIVDRKPSSLSGGQQQRVSLARALIRNSDITLLDEPISHMDQQVRSKMRARILHEHKIHQKTTVYVTHDQEDALALCDRMVIINFSIVEQMGTIDEIWNHPVNTFVASFVGEPKMNMVPAVVSDAHTAVVTGPSETYSICLDKSFPAVSIGKKILIGLRPQEGSLAMKSDRSAPVPGTVELIEFQGNYNVISLRLGDNDKTAFKICVPDGDQIVPGKTVWPRINTKDVHVFSVADGQRIELQS